MRAATVMLVLALAACGRRDEVPAHDDVTAAVPAGNEAEVDAALGNIVMVDNGTPAPGVPDVSSPSASDLRRQARHFPAALQGKWGLTPADCDISRSDTKGVMTVRGDAVSFYDASAVVSAVPEKSSYRIVADLDYRGGGRTWRRRERFEVVNGGTMLQRTAPVPPGTPPRTFRYEHC